MLNRLLNNRPIMVTLSLIAGVMIVFGTFYYRHQAWADQQAQTERVYLNNQRALKQQKESAAKSSSSAASASSQANTQTNEQPAVPSSSASSSSSTDNQQSSTPDYGVTINGKTYSSDSINKESVGKVTDKAKEWANKAKEKAPEVTEKVQNAVNSFIKSQQNK